MEIQTSGCLKQSTTFPTMSCLSAISIPSWKLSAVPEKMLWSNAQKHSNLTYLNNDEHTHLDRAKGSTDILDMAFISPNLTKLGIQFLIGDDLGSDRLPIEFSIDAQPHRKTHTGPIRYKFDQTYREIFVSTLDAALSSGDIHELTSTQDIDKYADFIVTAISTAVGKAIQNRAP